MNYTRKTFYSYFYIGMIFLVVMLPVKVHAQNERTVSGIVSDAKGEPLAGTVVKVKDEPSYGHANSEGKYTVKVTGKNPVLVFSYLGFETLEVAIGSKTLVDVKLKELYKDLDEVVVVGYGTQTKRELTGSVGSIKQDQIDQFAGGSLITSMQGKIAGLQITTNSGEPGAGANITLRGASSINGASQPLYIIDGVIIDNNSFTSLSDEATFSPLNDINPADIASIEVLKDAGTASIYGAMASNGVIIITTKSGSSAKKPVVNVSYNGSFVSIARKIGVLNATQFREANYEAKFNAEGIPPTRVALVDSLHPYYRNSYNWQDIMYRTSYQQKLDASVTGSSKDNSINYYVSLGYKDLKPIIVESKYRQVFGNAKTNYKIHKFIKGATSFNLSNYEYNRQNNSLISRYLTTMPVYSPYDEITGQLINLFESSKSNPLAQAKFQRNDVDRKRLIGNQEFTVDLMKGLYFRTSLSLDISNTQTYFYSPPALTNPSSANSIYSEYRVEDLSLINNSNTLTYTKRMNKKHHITALLGHSYRMTNHNSTYIKGINNIDNQITSINGSAQVISFNQNEQANALLSFFTRLNYDFESKYLFSFLLRRDSSSRFGKKNRSAYFPSVSGGWRFSQEDFLNVPQWIYDGKLRASYGITGNQSIGNYASLGAINRSGSYLEELALAVATMPNETLKWETTKQLNVGTDLSFIKGRFNLTLDYYIKNSSDLLFNVLIPSQTGYNNIPFNFGSLSNKGFEAELRGIVLDNKLKWTSVFTIGTNKNKITSLPGGEDYRPNNYNIARVGEPVGAFYGYKTLGVYARDEDNVYIDKNGIASQYRKGSSNGEVYKGGDVIFEDVNNDGVINEEDLQIIGDPNPKFFGGFQNSFAYKSFTLDVFVNYVLGNKVFNQLARSQDSNIWEPNYSIRQLRRWKKPGDVTDTPRLVRGDPMQNYAVSDLFLEDGSFIRVQNISLSYKLPKKTAKKLMLEDVSVGVSAQNLFTFGSYTGYDPEISSGSNPLGMGIDYGSFPKTKSYNFTINLKL